jgi:triacylglycerol lipase
MEYPVYEGTKVPAESVSLRQTAVTSGAENERTADYPVLIIPGYAAPDFQTDRVGNMLRAGGLDIVKVKLPWMAMGDMTRSAQIVADKVRRLTEYLGHEKVNFLGYSLGGIVARYYLQELDGHPTLGRAAFIASPNYGTYIGYLGFFSPAGRQVRTGSPLIRQLNESPMIDEIATRCLSIFIRWDGVIVPHLSSRMPYGYNLFHPRPISHWRAVMSPELVRRATEFLAGGLPEGAVFGDELVVGEAGGMVTVPWQAHERRRVWQVLFNPFRSFGSRLASIFRGRTGH